MAWIPPRTWVNGEAVTASKLNEISESLNYLKEPSDVVFRNTSNTNGLLRIARLSRRVSVPPQNGVGGFIEFRADTTTASEVVAAKIEWAWTNVTHASREGGMDFVLSDSTGEAIPLRLAAANGQPRVGFYGQTPVARPTVTGTRDENTALASLLTALANLGLITNETTTSTMENVLKTNATYGWTAGTLPSDATGNWVDVVQGLTLMATGNPQATVLANGRRAVQFNGGQWFRGTFQTTLTQPTAIVTVSKRTGDLSIWRAIHHSSASPSSHYLAHRSDMGMTMYAGNYIIAANTSTTNLIVTVATYNTTNSSLRINGVQVVSGDAGNTHLSGITIGATSVSTNPFIGQIAMVAVVNGTNYEARAAAIETHAMNYYGVTQ